MRPKRCTIRAMRGIFGDAPARRLPDGLALFALLVERAIAISGYQGGQLILLPDDHRAVAILRAFTTDWLSMLCLHRAGVLFLILVYRFTKQYPECPRPKRRIFSSDEPLAQR